MLPYKKTVDRLREAEKVTSRVNVAVYRFAREIYVVSDISNMCQQLIIHNS